MVGTPIRDMTVSDFQNEDIVGTNEFGHPIYRRIRENGHVIRRFFTRREGNTIYYKCIHCKIVDIEQSTPMERQYQLGKLLTVTCPNPNS